MNSENAENVSDAAADDTRNVIDRYKGWDMDAIIADLDSRRHPFHVAIENWQHDFNIGSVVRTANAFLAKEVHIIGNRRWNRRGAMVTDRYQHIRHHPTVEEFVAWARAEGVAVIAIDNLPGSVPSKRTPCQRRQFWCLARRASGYPMLCGKRPTPRSPSRNMAPRAPSTRVRQPRLRCTRGCGNMVISRRDIEGGPRPIPALSDI